MIAVRDVRLWAGVSLAAAFLLAAWANLDGFAPPADAFAFLEYALVLALLAAGAVVDARTRLVPDVVPLGIAAVHVAWVVATVAFGWASAPAAVGSSVAGALAVGGGLLAFTLAYERVAQPDAFGGGDVKVLAALGFALGAGRAVAVLAVACAAFCLWMLGCAARAWLAGAAWCHDGPFVPAIAVGTFVVLAMG